MVFSGLVGATCAGLIIDFFKLFKEVAVVSLSLGMLCFIWFTEASQTVIVEQCIDCIADDAYTLPIQVFNRTGQGVNIAFSVCLFGFFGLPLIPACMELGVEVTYPVSEATSSGLLWSMTYVSISISSSHLPPSPISLSSSPTLSSHSPTTPGHRDEGNILPVLCICNNYVYRQVMGIVLVLTGQAIQSEVVVVDSNTCVVHKVSNSSGLHCLFSNSSSSSSGAVVPQDFTNALLLYVAVGTMALLLMIILFRPKYHRLEVEQRAEGILQRLRGPEKNPPSLSSASPSSASFPHGHPDSVKALSPPADKLMLTIKPECQTSTEL